MFKTVNERRLHKLISKEIPLSLDDVCLIDQQLTKKIEGNVFRRVNEKCKQ